MSLPLYNIGGLASGLDTASIISELVAIERIPVTRLEARRDDYEARDTAWQQVNTKLSALSTAIGKINDRSDWNSFTTATSSNETAVEVSTSSGATPSSLSISVTALAERQQSASGLSLTSGADIVGAGQLTITAGGTDFIYYTDDGSTLDDLALQINQGDSGVRASVIQTDAANARLVLTADESGTEHAFTTTATQASLGTFNTIQAAADATIEIGSGVDALTVTRSSNTIDDLMAGVTLTLKDTTTQDVTVRVQRDTAAAVEAVKAVVDEANAALDTLDRLTAYNEESGAAGVLQGDPTARQLILDIRSLVSNPIDGLTGSMSYAAGIGISTTREGNFEFSESDFTAALESDFDAVVNLLSRSVDPTSEDVRFTGATSSTVDGTYAVQVTQAAARGMVTGSAFATGGGSFSVTSGDNVANITIGATDDLGTAVDAINTALDAAGITTVTASQVSGAIALTESRFGSSATFTVADTTYGLDGTHAGADVVGTIDGVAAEGTGRSLRATAGDSTGLTLQILATQDEVTTAGGTLDLGSVTVRAGVAQRMEDFLDQLQDTDGRIAEARNSAESMIDFINDRIEVLEDRIEQKELTLRRQFTALESAMNDLMVLSSSIASQLSGLPTA